MFAQRTHWNLAKNELSKVIENHNNNSISYLDLTLSNPTEAGFPFPEREILGVLSNPAALAYHPHPKGLFTARQAVSEYYQQWDYLLEPEHIVLTASTSEAYSFLFKLLTNPGEEVLAAVPSYPLFDFLADLQDIRLNHFRLAYQDGWKINPDEIRNQISNHTRILMLVNPNNPTGHYIPPEDQRTIIQICKEYNLVLVVDEVFLDYGFKEDKPPSFLGNKEVLTFVLSGISKILCLPQMKLAWIAASGPEPILTDALSRLEVISDTYLSVNTPVQLAFPQWMELHSQIREMVRERVETNLNILKGMLKECQALQLLKADAGWYAILKIPINWKEEDSVVQLLEKDHVLVHPGYFFDFPQEGYWVISLITTEDVFKQGIEKIINRVNGIIT